MKPLIRNSGYILAAAAVIAIGLIAFRGPQGVPSLIEKREQIRKLQESNADLTKENNEKRRRIMIIKSQPSALELEMRNRLKLQREGETSYIIPGKSE